MNKHTPLIFSLPLLALLAACSNEHGHPHAEGAHGPEAHAPAGHDDEHGHDDHGHGGGITVTHYTPLTELFVEYPPLALNGESAFAAHLTWLKDFSAVNEGALTVILSGGGQPEERMTATVSQTPGIFRPVLTPKYAGQRQLQLVLTARGMESRHDLGQVTVWPNTAAAAAAAPEEAETPDLIGFTKEQQWKMDFATAVAEDRLLRDSIAVTATVLPRASGQAVVSATGPGILKPGPKGFPQLGQHVRSGEVIAWLTPRLDVGHDLADLTLAEEQAAIRLEQARGDRERLEKLFAGEAIPEKRVIEARQLEKLAQAEWRAARQRSQNQQGGAGGIALKAPVSGTIVAVNAAPGASVDNGRPLLQIADLDTLWLEARISESDAGKVGVPDGAWFNLNGTDAPVRLESGRNARLIAYGGMVHPATRTIPAILEFDNKARKLRIGMSLPVRLYTGKHTQAVSIPASALLDDNGQSVVFVLREGESFERRVVTPGLRDGDRVAVLNGLASGERVVSRGAYQVRLAATAPAAMGHGHAH